MDMPTLVCVSEKRNSKRQFCFTDCSPSEGCNPDDFVPDNKKK